MGATEAPLAGRIRLSRELVLRLALAARAKTGAPPATDLELEPAPLPAPTTERKRNGKVAARTPPARRAPLPHRPGKFHELDWAGDCRERRKEQQPRQLMFMADHLYAKPTLTSPPPPPPTSTTAVELGAPAGDRPADAGRRKRRSEWDERRATSAAAPPRPSGALTCGGVRAHQIRGQMWAGERPSPPSTPPPRSKVVKSQLESSWRRVDANRELHCQVERKRSSIFRRLPAAPGGSGKSVILAARARPVRPLRCDSGRRWAHLALALALALLLPLTGGRPDAGAEGPPASGDELSRAVLATMSTRAPPPLVAGGNAIANATTAAAAAIANDANPEQPHWLDSLLEVGRIFVMSAIIVGDICGNSLVILSVCRHSKLRVTTNWFVVSLACADILVALFAMTFNASVIVSGRWLFKPWVCDFWNSCDVLASTASILHLCCISIDRYIAIMRPLDYPMKITTRRVVYALCAVWISSALLSYIPIFTGVYTTAEHIQWLKENPDQCEFVVNRVYAIVSSSISFWIPCCIMVFTYYRIYREATRQEKFIYKAQAMMPAPQNHHHHQHHHHQQQQHGKQRRSKSVAVAGASSEARLKQLAKQQQQLQPPAQPKIATTNLNSAPSIPAIAAGPHQEQAAAVGLLQSNAGQQEEEDDGQGSNSGQSTPTKRSISKMKREHKAAKTLGIIMGVFILCWLPFFSWYTPMHICGHACDNIVPRGAVSILFWIGYFNSTLNPIIYAYFNHEFRDAFKKTLQWLFCCCQDLKCLRVNRPNDNQHYNCTYRSTQEIGLVSNS